MTERRAAFRRSITAFVAAAVPAVLILFAALSLLAPPPAAAEEMALDNGRVRAEFNDRGLVSLSAPKAGRTLTFSADPALVTIDGAAILIGSLGPAEIEMTPAKVAYRYARDPFTFDVVYELKPAWDFLTKQIVVTSARGRAFRINEVKPFAASLGLPVAEELALSKGTFGALCRFAASDAPSSAVPAWSVFFMLQNPFLAWSREGRAVALSYAPDMDWSRDLGPFASDRLCLGLVELSGTRFPAKAVPEWKLVADYAGLLAASPTIDANEVEALTGCVRSFLLYYPGRSVRVHIPWCENDYQIDVGTAEGVEEYKRIMDRAAELGVTHLLYTPANSSLSRLEDNADSWGWENVLWFGLGQKLRKGEWDPRRDAVPDGLQAMLDHAASKNLKLMAYAYPSLPFLQNPDWTAWAGPNAGEGGRRHRPALLPGLVARQAPGLHEDHGRGRLFLRPLVDRPGQGLEQVRPVVRRPGASSKSCAARPSTSSSTAASSTRTSARGPGWPARIPTRP